MAGQTRHLLNRSGRYFARLVVPKDLRPFVGKTELRAPLGPDRRQAMRLLPAALADLQHEIAVAERKARPATARVRAPRYPLRPEEIAGANYRERLAFDDELRRLSPLWPAISIDDGLVAKLRDGMAGKLNDDALDALIGDRIERFRSLGNTDAARGSQEWRDLARSLCFSEYEALSRVAERDEGDFDGRSAVPFLTEGEPNTPDPVQLDGLFRDYLAARRLVGKGREAEKRWAPVIANLKKHLGHGDAAKITKADLRAWRDALLEAKLSPRTVAQVYLASIRTILAWAVQNDRLPENVAENVRQDIPKASRNREKGYTIDEARKILAHSRAYAPKADEWGNVREHPTTTAAKRWVPLLCAHSGARVVEITQLRKGDFRRQDGALVMRITPEAGTVKTAEYRDVPLHPELIDQGFSDFLDSLPAGPIFHNAGPKGDALGAARIMSGKIAKWLRDEKLTAEGVAPNHGWRHRFKTVGREAGIADRVLDAINGHASGTAGDSYGDVTIKTMNAAIETMPPYLPS